MAAERGLDLVLPYYELDTWTVGRYWGWMEVLIRVTYLADWGMSSKAATLVLL